MIERAFLGIALLFITGMIFRRELNTWWGALTALGAYVSVLWLMTP